MEAHCSLAHLESLVRRKKWRMEALMELAWAHSFMEGARRLEASLFVC
jgi:hypothetical protein